MKTKFSGVSELCIPLEIHANIYQRTNLAVRMRYCHQSQGNRQSPGRSENQKGKYFSPELPGMGCSGLGVRWTWAQGICALLAFCWWFNYEIFPHLRFGHLVPSWYRSLGRLWEHGEVESRSSEYIVLCFFLFLSLSASCWPSWAEPLSYTPISHQEPSWTSMPSPSWWTDVISQRSVVV